MINSAYQYLKTNPLLHISMLEVLRRGHGRLLYAGGDGVLLLETRSNTHMLSASTPDAAKRLAAIGQANVWVIHQSFCIPILREKYGLQSMHDCLNAVYTRREKLPLSRAFQVRMLDQTHAQTVIETYRTMDDAQYIRTKIGNGEMFGAFKDAALAGFVGVHDEGSIGLLEVLPNYRRMGVGSLLEGFLVNRQLERGWTPFCQIFPDNAASLSLQKKLGFEIAREHTYWLF